MKNSNSNSKPTKTPSLAPKKRVKQSAQVSETTKALRVSLPQNLTLPQVQDQVDMWIKSVGVRYFSPLTNMALLTEEVGEVARLMSRLYGDQSFKKNEEKKSLADELADVFFVLVCIANQTEVDLQKAFVANMAKKNKRDLTRHRNNPKLIKS